MSDRRMQTRMLCADLVQVRWEDETGRPKTGVANLEDISLSGACLQMDVPIRQDTVVRIQHPKGEFQGKIRYCLFRDIGYFLGVQFEPGCKWSPHQYHPRHLLDLRRLVTRAAKRATETAGPAPTVQ